MFDIGFFELLLIGIVGLLVLGPERLPKAARTAGLWVGRIKRSVSGMQREITSQLEAEELRQKVAEQQKKLDAGVSQARRSVEESFESTISSATESPSRSVKNTTRPSATVGSSDEPAGAVSNPTAAHAPTTDDKPQPDKDSAAR